MKNNMRAEYFGYEKLFMGITGKRIRVRNVPESSDAVGYTSKEGGIFIAYEHPIMDGLSEEEKKVFRKGVFVHEMLHQVFTNFDVYERKIRAYPSQERAIAGNFFNILEDPAIERWAPTVIGGLPLTALRFTIAHIYKISEDIDNAPNPLAQFMNALINFGDLGLIKGSFTFSEARECFKEAAPIFYEGINAANCQKRLECAAKIMELSKPLWADEAEFAKMLEELAKEMAKNGKSPMTGKGKGRDGDNSGLPDDETSKDKNRKITIKKISKEEMEKMEKSSSVSKGGLPDDGDITVYVCDEDYEDDKGKEGTSISLPSDGDKSEKENDKSKEPSFSEDKNLEMDSDEENAETKGDTNDSDEDGEEKDDKNDSDSKSDKGSPEGCNNPFRSPPSNSDIHPDEDEFIEDDSPDAETLMEEYTLTADDIAYIEAEAEREIREFNDKEKAESPDSTPLDNFNITSHVLGKKKCLNYKVNYGASEEDMLRKKYNAVVNRYKTPIAVATSQLKKIFENDKEEKEYRTSGRVNAERASGGRITSRVFEKRRLPADKSNLSVTILVDESGSMSGYEKYVAARESCIALAEIFSNLNIPLYVIGFTADTQGADVVHNHYVTWKNSPGDRLKLLNISARANNMDGYSVRYATEIIKKNNASHKLFIVLSDGLPAAYGYSGSPGLADTKEAIRDAKKECSVLGVLIGNADVERSRYMYEQDFMHISNANDLFVDLTKKIKNIIRNW